MDEFQLSVAERAMFTCRVLQLSKDQAVYVYRTVVLRAVPAIDECFGWPPFFHEFQGRVHSNMMPTQFNSFQLPMCNSYQVCTSRVALLCIVAHRRARLPSDDLLTLLCPTLHVTTPQVDWTVHESEDEHSRDVLVQTCC